MSTSLAPELHLCTQLPNNFCEKLVIEEFQGPLVVTNREGHNGYQDTYAVDSIPADQTKANHRKRNKKRVSLKEVEIRSKVVSDPVRVNPDVNVDNNFTFHRNAKASWDDKQGKTRPVIPACETLSEPIIRVAPSSSYAAVVSGRNWGGSSKSESFLTGLEDDGFLPLAAMSILNKKPVSSSSASVDSGSVRDVGIQVNLPIKDDAVWTKSRNQGTMTSKRGQCKNKFVSVKICCNDSNKDKGSSDLDSIPPVQFLGDDFTFQNALAKTVAQLGIKFME